LISHETSDGFMENPQEKDSAQVKEQLKKIAPSDESPGDRIGRYQLLERIGEGSGGTVWMALQIEDIERRVALKILKLGLDTKEFLARFEAERQILALMDHPNVASVLDAGATDFGRPYFVMELVKGIPILEYCDKKKLSIEDRVKLVIKVCHGVQHAHQTGIIHRDLKPSNILVAVQDDEPDPRIIDFGIAKTTHYHLTDKTLYTGIHTFIGTPVYSSPEQLDCSSLDVDYRSDIYSLGAMLYELLCGKPPFDHKRLSKLGLNALQKFVLEKDPVRPSILFSNLSSDDQADISGFRSTSRPKVHSQLKGDLDWIIMKCLEKDPARRYETALDLLQDLEAYLKDDPVTAVAPSLGYQVKKFIQRKRPAYAIWLEVTAAILAILLLVSYIRPGTANSSPSTLRFTNNSIAVLPLNNLSPDPGNSFFADGVQEDVLSNLSNIEDLLVIPRTSMLQYRGTVKTLSQIANELGVRYLVEGSIRKSGNRILVTVQLLEAQTGRQQWSGYFERELDDSFATQNAIAKEIAAKIELALLPEAPVETVP